MDSDLQDALDFVENDSVLTVVLATSHSLGVVVEAARKYANPDLTAMARLFASMDGYDFDEFNINYQKGWLNKVERLWNAALDVTEDV